jgi:hypothetical protein
VVIACCKHPFPYRHRHIFQLGPVKLFDRSIEGIAIDMNDSLSEISGKLKLSDVLIRSTKIRGQIDSLELSFPRKNSIDFLRESLVFVFFVVEELRALRSIIDDFRDLLYH